jgi:hypothetical protein
MNFSIPAHFVRKSVSFIAVSALLSTSASAIAQPSRHETKFKVKFGGLTVGEVTFGVALDGNDYTFTGNGQTQGLADWFAKGKAVIKSEGRLAGSRTIASSHYLSVTEKKDTAVLKMKFKNGWARDVYVNPDKRKKFKTEPKYAVFKPGDLGNVIDPASTMVVPVPVEQAKDPNAVCDHLFRVYDGDTRFDIKLSYKSNQPIKTEGYDGYAYVCKLQYIPIAGHKRKNKGTVQMAANNDMEIWLAPISGGDPKQSVFTAIRINIPTWVGTFTSEPDYFGPAKS